MKKSEQKQVNPESSLIQTSYSFVDELDFKQFPFKTSFSLQPLVDFWKEINNQSDSDRLRTANTIVEKLSKAPHLLETITDFRSTYNQNNELIDSLMTAIVPRSSFDDEMIAIVPPFSYQPFFQTPKFAALRAETM